MLVRSNVDATMCIIMKAHASHEALGEVWEGKETVATVPPNLDSFPLTAPYGEHLRLTREEEEERVRVHEERSRVQRCYAPHCYVCLFEYEGVYAKVVGLSELARAGPVVPPPA